MVPAAAWGPTDDTGARYAVAAIRTEHATFPAWNRPVEVTLRDRGGVIDVVGIVRPVERATSRGGPSGPPVERK